MTPFRLPTRVFIARGSRLELATEIARTGGTKVLLMTDEGLWTTHWPGELTEHLESAGFLVSIDASTKPNPRAHDVDRVARTARTEGVDCVVGLGGGSVLDAAKAVSMLLTNEGAVADYEGRNRFEHAPAPYFAVPTTCGTGSEVTWVSVISVPESQVKISVKGDGMFPTAAFVDADLIDTLPANLVATTGMDAVTHAIEAYIGKASNPTSDVLAVAALSRLLPALEAMAFPDHSASMDHASIRAALMEGSTIAGMSFGNADVGAVHCLSEAIGGVADLPHGLLNAALLVPVLTYMEDMIADRLHRLGRLLPPTAEPDLLLLDRLERLRDGLGIPAKNELPLDANMFETCANLAEKNGSNGSNLRKMTAADYRAILVV